MRKLWSRLGSAIEHFKDNLTEAQWDGLRAAAVVAILAAAGAAAYYGGSPLWRRWQNRQALSQAKAFQGRKDYRDMLLALRRATELEPMDLTTWRQVQSALSEIGSPETIFADQQLAALSSSNAGFRFALIEDALRFGKLATAQSELARLDTAARRDAAFHRLAAALAMALGRSAEFESEVAALVAADPHDLNARFTYATLRLWSADTARSASGRNELLALLDQPATRVRSALELMSAGAREQSPAAFEALLKRLVALFAPGVKPDFSTPDPPAWRSLLAGMEKSASSSPGDAALMARWLAGIGRTNEALAFLARLPPSSANSVIVLDAAAELDASAGRLGAFDVLLRRGAWGPVPDDAVTLAIAAHVQRGGYDARRARGTWEDAVQAGGNSTTGLRALARMAAIWGETDASDEALRALLARSPEASWAYRALRNDYTAAGNLKGLWALYAKWVAVHPDDDEAAAQWILVGCIIDEPVPDALRRAFEAHKRDPSSRLYDVALAAALWRDRRPDEAWEVLAALSPQERRHPAVAFWVAVVRADLADLAGTASALNDAGRANLTGDQKTLLRRAAIKVGAPWAGR